MQEPMPSPPPLLDAFLVDWASTLKDVSRPLSNHFPDCSLRPWLGRLALIERRADSRFRFLLVGTKLSPRLEVALTGRCFDEISANILCGLDDRVMRAVWKQEPVAALISVPFCSHRYFELLLPICNSDGAVDLVLLASCLDDCSPSSLH